MTMMPNSASSKTSKIITFNTFVYRLTIVQTIVNDLFIVSSYTYLVVENANDF